MGPIDSNRTLLKTFVQISDLHFGQIDPRSGDAVVSTAAVRFVQNLPWFDGLLGHHGRALEELQQFCSDFADNGEKIEIIVTGDLTRCGDVGEISTVHNFLAATVDLSPPSGRNVGLALGSMPAASITGNHDQWGGVNFPLGGGPLAPCALVPSAMPYVLHRPLTNGRRLLIAGIDTDSRTARWGMKRLLAIGSFQDQLVALRQKLPRPQAGDIRVMLAHHSYSCKKNVLRMDGASKAALEAFLFDHNFRILLSGHTHEHDRHSFTATGHSGSAQVDEITCGSTTQHDQIPYSWRNILGGFPKRMWTHNTLIVHRIFGEPGATTWESQVYSRLAKGYQSLGARYSYSINL